MRNLRKIKPAIGVASLNCACCPEADPELLELRTTSMPSIRRRSRRPACGRSITYYNTERPHSSLAGNSSRRLSGESE